VREREKVRARKGGKSAAEWGENEKKRRIGGDGSGTVVAERLVSRTWIPVHIEANPKTWPHTTEYLCRVLRREKK